MLRAGESATSAHKIGIIHIMKWVRNRHDRRFLAWFAGIMPPWLAVYAEIYFLDKFIIWTYSFRAYGRRRRADASLAAADRLFSHVERRKEASRWITWWRIRLFSLQTVDKRKLCVFFRVTVNLRIWRADARAVSVYYQFQWICDMYNFAKPRVLQPNRSRWIWRIWKRLFRSQD